MKPRYKEEKTAQMAALFLRLRGGKMSYIKLLKLMYMVDREALARFGRPVSYDSFSSLEHGPILSTTYNRIKGEKTLGKPEPAWEKYITTRQGYDVKLKQEAPVAELSEAEIRLIREIFDQFGNWYRWKIVNYMHDHFPEWKDPGESSAPIDYSEVLRAKDKTPEEAEEIEAEIDGLAIFERLTA